MPGTLARVLRRRAMPPGLRDAMMKSKENQDWEYPRKGPAGARGTSRTFDTHMHQFFDSLVRLKWCRRGVGHCNDCDYITREQQIYSSVQESVNSKSYKCSWRVFQCWHLRPRIVVAIGGEL